MNFTNIIKTYEGDELKKAIIDPLVTALTVINKYNIFPNYIMQFMISKVGYVPYIVLTSYEDKNLLIETSSYSSHLEEVMHNKSPKTAAQTVIVYPENIKYSDVILENSDEFYYSSSYLISGKELKDNIKNGRIEFYKLELVSDLNRTKIQTNLFWKMIPYSTKDPDGEKEILAEECIGKIPSSIKLFQAPFINYSNITKKYNEIISAIINIANNPLSVVIEDDDVLKDMFETIKEKQMVDIPRLNDIKVFKDFVKVKPTKLTVVASKEKYTNENDGLFAISVFFNMYFKSSHYNAGIFYKYIDSIFNNLIGSIED